MIELSCRRCPCTSLTASTDFLAQISSARGRAPDLRVSGLCQNLRFLSRSARGIYCGGVFQSHLGEYNNLLLEATEHARASEPG